LVLTPVGCGEETGRRWEHSLLWGAWSLKGRVELAHDGTSRPGLYSLTVISGFRLL
jgi:hypothetical protein